MRDRLLLGVARPVRGSSVKILRQNRLLYTVMHTAGLDLSTLAALVLPALLYPICLLLAPEPRAVRSIERIGPYHPTFRGVPKSSVRAADLGDVPFRSRYSLQQSLQDIEHYYSALKAQGVRPLSVGGDHSITYPILKALGKDSPVGLVHLAAHCDTMG